ncbi:hypothetical protein FALBO_11017 [Fusarium albosuccineum]|uniref:Uncharacterized protein n=1 Tax=Fusarium albosuccineum TaxID=1237068 RepID=A0A8H4L3C6_9HYPO|nr:hypothetical protein FALBO_11017 [Fusarium albosuccineum]
MRCSYGSGGFQGYSYGALSSMTPSHSREPSTSRRSSAYAPSARSRQKNSTDEYHSRTSNAHTRESSLAGRTSIDSECGHYHHRRQPERRRSDDASQRPYDRQRHRHHQYPAYHSRHRDDTHGRRRYRPRELGSPSKERSLSYPTEAKVVMVKSNKKSNKTWQQRISLGLAKSKEHSQVKPERPVSIEPKTKKKGKWAWWGKKKNNSPGSPEKEPAVKAREINRELSPRPGVWEWIGEEPPPHQSPDTLKQLFEREY